MCKIYGSLRAVFIWRHTYTTGQWNARLCLEVAEATKNQATHSRMSFICKTTRTLQAEHSQQDTYGSPFMRLAEQIMALRAG